MINLNLNDMYEILLCATLVVLIIVYCIYVIIDEKQKIKYYNKTFRWITNWDKYNTMIKRQRKIILKKKVQLYFFKTLVRLKRAFK